MKTKLLIFATIFCFPFLLNAQTQIGTSVVFSDAAANFGQVAAINNTGDFFITSASYLFNNNETGLARVYNFQSNSWTQVGSDLVGNANDDSFGVSVAMNEVGNTVAVGATQPNATGPGYVKVFQFSSGQYVQIGNDIIGETSGDNFGSVISINGDGTKLIVGAIHNDANTGSQFASVGHIRMYSFDGTDWNMMGSEIDGNNPNDNFGDSVDISKDGNRIVVSASGFDDGGVNKGLVRVYEFSGGNWVQLGQDIIGDSDNDRLFNASMNDDGTRIAFVRAGTVRVYEYNGSQWVMLGNEITGMSSDILTSNLDDTGNVVAVASRIANSGTGYVQMYEFINGNWAQKGSTLDGNATGDNFGASVEVKSNFLVVGASDFNLGTANNGGVSAYDFNAALSTKDDQLLTDIRLFPNPTIDILKVTGAQIKTLTLYDLNGRNVRNSSNENMSVRGLTKGMYLMRITDSENRTAHKKIIVQ